MPPKEEEYSSWTNEQLINRVTKLEAQLREKNADFTAKAAERPRPPKKPRVAKPFDPEKYNTRYIALKLAYLGQNYNGFEHHANNPTPLPTVEEELWKALTKTKLIFPSDENEINWDGWEYSKCGRTDKGVSAFGQVIALRVRSNRPKNESDGTVANVFDPVEDELSYPRILNRVLPEDIRVLAWCPSPPAEFSARFSCRERRYRYFFTNPSHLPLPGDAGIATRKGGSKERDGWLDIETMRNAAQYFVGLHDFRNFAKHDPSKQVTNYDRRIFEASVEEAESSQGMVTSVGEQSLRSVIPSQEPRVYYFSVCGTAFLWHQVRHMVAVLFLIGQGLESPSIIPELLKVDANPTKPHYEMADDAPLVLWDCIFPDGEDQRQDTLEWILVDGQSQGKDRKQAFSSSGDGRNGPGGLNEVLWNRWRKAKMDEILTGSLLDAVASPTAAISANGSGDAATFSFGNPWQDSNKSDSTRVFKGGNGPVLKGQYVPIMQRPRMESIEVQNERYARRKDFSGQNGTPTAPSSEAE